MMWTMMGHVHQRCSEKDRIFHHSCPPLISPCKLGIATSQTQKPPTLISCSLGLGAWKCSNIAVTPGSMGVRSSVNKCAALRFKYFLKKDFHAGRVKAPIGFFDASVLLGWSFFCCVCFFFVWEKLCAGVGGLKKHKQGNQAHPEKRDSTTKGF